MLYFILLLFYVLLLFLLSLIPSISLCSVVFSPIPNNFKCGFYSIIISLLRYRFNYRPIPSHSLTSEQESIPALLLVYGIQSLNSNWIVIIPYFISLIDSLLYLNIPAAIIYYVFNHTNESCALISTLIDQSMSINIQSSFMLFLFVLLV